MSKSDQCSSSEPPLKKRLVCDAESTQNGAGNSCKTPQKAHAVTAKIAAADSGGSAALDYSSSTLNCTGSSEFEANRSGNSDSPSTAADRVAAADFSALKIVRVLSSSDASCSVAVEARHNTEEGRVLVQLQKTPFDLDKLEDIVSGSTTLSQIFQNDVYSKHTATLPPQLNKIQATIIHPAQDKHFLRYEKQLCTLVEETSHLYNTVTKPFIMGDGCQGKQWIYNILEGVSEAERVILRDTDPEIGFVLLPDLKWTGEQLSDLYCQAIVNRRDLASIRDLTGDCLPLLRNIRDKGTRAIKEKYGVDPARVRAYFHYLPSFFHLHVHFAALTFDAPGTWCGKAHLLCDVISNLEQNSDHYRRATIAFTVKDNHPHPLAKDNRDKEEEKDNGGGDGKDQ